MTWICKSATPALLLSFPASAAELAQHHKVGHFNAGRVLQAYPPSLAPALDEKAQKNRCAGNLDERIDLTHPVCGIDARLCWRDVAYYLQNESNGSDEAPTLPRDVSAYCSPAELKQVAKYYAASAELNVHASCWAPDLPALAETAHALCAALPTRWAHQEYDAHSNGIRHGSGK